MRAPSTEALAVLEAASVTPTLVTLNSGQLERPLYVEVDKVLRAAGGKWDRRQGGHVFTDDPRDWLEVAIADGTYTDPQRDLGAFDTPRAIAERLVTAADIPPGVRVLEPSAGAGKLAEVILGEQLRLNPEAATYDLIDCFEIQEQLAGKLGFRYGPRQAGTYTLLGYDWLEFAEPREWDRIIANPPFGKGRAVAHFMKMWEHLAPGGRLVCVLPYGIGYREDQKRAALRGLIMTHGRLEKLPGDAFRESGTRVRTLLAVVDKPELQGRLF